MQSILSIGFDAKRLFHNRTGLGNYSRTLVRNLRKYNPEIKIYLFTPSVSEHSFAEEFLNEELYTIVMPPKYANKSYWRSHGMTKQIKELNLDLYHGLSNELPMKRVDGTQYLVTIHDVIFKSHPQYYKKVDAYLYDKKTTNAVANADKIIAISQATKQALSEYYQAEESKIEVLYQSCGWEYTPFREVKKNGLLFVSSLTDRKNLITLLKAINRLKEIQPQQLIVIGSGKSGMQKAQKYINQNGLNESVFFVGTVGDDGILDYYENAEILVYPSLVEGFGIPVIEAISSGTHVITTANTSMSEAGGDLAHYLNDPIDEIELADLILKVNTAPALSSEKINDHLSQFSTDVTTQKLSALYNSVLA